MPVLGKSNNRERIVRDFSLVGGEESWNQALNEGFRNLEPVKGTAFGALLETSGAFCSIKFGHSTFFWNGNRSGYFNPEMEEYVEIPSDSGITFNVKPKTKAVEIAEKARDAILSRKFHQVHVNLPNGDMVGHTGDIEATVVACRAIDEVVKVWLL
ncbi:2,3-bisphosphoglycerate-independent phosphoglycerate mutase [Sarracenia purpurea var. burkii]